jgi:hypothetical protein
MTRALWSLSGEGEHIWFLGSLVTIKVPGEAVDGRCTLIEFLAPRGLSPPLHSHPQDETFTLIDGALTFVAGDERFLFKARRELDRSARDQADIPSGERHHAAGRRVCTGRDGSLLPERGAAC